jgi:hypothetical protein
MKGMIVSGLESPQGQELSGNYLSSPDDHTVICEFVISKKRQRDHVPIKRGDDKDKNIRKPGLDTCITGNKILCKKQ